MPDIEPIDAVEADENTSPSDSENTLIELSLALEKRCKEATIQFEPMEGFDDDVPACKIAFQCGREKRWVMCWDKEDYESLISIPFENYTFIHGFDAIVDYRNGTVEAAVRSLANQMPGRNLSRLVFGTSEDSPQGPSGEGNRVTLFSDEEDSLLTIELGEPSQELRALVSFPPRLSIKIRRDGLRQHDQASELLVKSADALFFQVDLLTGAPLSLTRDRSLQARRRPRHRRVSDSTFSFPTHEYDRAPISLYWYARSAIGMPLLQFLAYYQVIEYYFPTYSQAEARRRIKAIIKDPLFRGERDADLGRLLTAIHVSRSGAFGDERSQLKATLNECIDAEALREFLTSDSERKEFLSSKARGLVEHKLPIANATADLRSDVAERIYEIRCKIVHTKTDARNGEFELLLPFSKEAEQLTYDIELVQYVAQKVLVAASTPFNF